MANGPALSTAQRRKIYVESEFRDSFSVLDVLYTNHFEGNTFDPTDFEQTEENFYRGAPPKWLNFHISEQADGTGTTLIRRDGYETLVQQVQQKRNLPGTSTVKLFHESGCGGTTLAMQVLWHFQKTLRCAVLADSSSDVENVAEEVVHLFTSGHRDSNKDQNTVLLLVNDEQILDNLQDSIMTTIAEQKIVIHKTRKPVAILLSCVRKDAIFQSNHIVLKRSLSETEKKKFTEKKEELTRRYKDKCEQFHGFNIMQSDFSEDYVKQACAVVSKVRKGKRPLKTQLAAFLSLLNAYVPGSYLLESQCLNFLRHEDSIHGKVPLEDKMQPFSHLIVTFQQDEKSERRVCMAHPMIAKTCTELMAEAGVTRSDTARNLLTFLCGDKVPPYLLGFVKDMLTKREIRTEEGRAETSGEKEKFSRLILDIQKKENDVYSASVLKVASNKFNENPFFPQALARVCYIKLRQYDIAKMWAKRAGQRDPHNSFVADTLGQVHKNHLKNTETSATPRTILHLAQKAIEAFKHEERLAENELDPGMKGDGMSKVSHIFNNRGQFGYLQVCNILFDHLAKKNKTWREVLTKKVSMSSVLTSLGDNKLYRFNDLIRSLRDDVKKNCDHLNSLLTYSKPGMQKQDPSYIMTDMSSCYKNYIECPLPDPVMEIMKRFMNKDKEERDVQTPEAHIVALLRGWPADDEISPPNFMQLIENINDSYDREYARYFRSRYLRPLFYLGIDEADGRVVPTNIDRFLLENKYVTEDFVDNLMRNDRIFRDLRVQAELRKFHGVVKNYSIFTTVGNTEIKIKADIQDSVWIPRDVSFYLGFTIRGPVAFGIQTKENGPPRRCPSADQDEKDSGEWKEVIPRNDGRTCRHQSGAGKFQCSVTGLRWVCRNQVTFEYQFRSWSERKAMLDIVHCTPGGPLLGITVNDGKLDEVHLPHWICTDGFSTVSDKFAVVHEFPDGNLLEQVSNITATHIKLFYREISTHGVLVRAGFPVKVHCNVLIFKINILTFRVYVIPRDPALQKEVEQTERKKGSRIVRKPNPKMSFQMLDSFKLIADGTTAQITPDIIHLRHEFPVRKHFTVTIKDSNSVFRLILRHKEEDIWFGTDLTDEKQN